VTGSGKPADSKIVAICASDNCRNLPAISTRPASEIRIMSNVPSRCGCFTVQEAASAQIGVAAQFVSSTLPGPKVAPTS
jgi:hypothetical protein